MQVIQARVGKTLTITFRTGETVNAKIISADRSLDEDADFYFIDLDRAPEAEEGVERQKAHVYSGTFEEIEDLEVPDAA
jgi:hypothetical protein